ncbi:hypothetical protein EON66_09260, partial [archaeon]
MQSDNPPLLTTQPWSSTMPSVDDSLAYLDEVRYNSLWVAHPRGFYGRPAPCNTQRVLRAASVMG